MTAAMDKKRWQQEDFLWKKRRFGSYDPNEEQRHGDTRTTDENKLNDDYTIKIDEDEWEWQWKEQ